MARRSADTVAKRPAKATSGEMRLSELTRDQLSVFLYVSLLPQETLALVKELGLSMPGFRTDALGDVERCDLIADEIQARPEAAGALLETMRKAFERPPLLAQRLAPEGARDLLLVCGGESPLPPALWRVLSDPDRRVRAAAQPVLDDLAAHYYAPHTEGEAPSPEPAPQADSMPERVAALERELSRARQRAEEVRRRGEAHRDKLHAQLKEARAREAQALGEAARARDAADAGRRELSRVEEALATAQATDAAQQAQRARAQARDLEAKVAALESRLERERERSRELEAALAAARSAATAARASAARPSEDAEREPTEEAETDQSAEEEGFARRQAEAKPEHAGDPVSTWLMPIYTREFYDSLEGWERRVQRAAFKQAHLLALDHRHPSLRALPLEGLPGYYRVRVATDVRLLYRRGERQNSVEILSLIDREDLNRYIKQAKTRG